MREVCASWTRLEYTVRLVTPYGRATETVPPDDLPSNILQQVYLILAAPLAVPPIFNQPRPLTSCWLCDIPGHRF